MALLKQRVERLERAARGSELDGVRNLIERAQVILRALKGGEDLRPDTAEPAGLSGGKRIAKTARELLALIRN